MKLRAVLLLSVLLIGSSILAFKSVPKSFEPEARAATGAIFVDRVFHCSGTEIGHTLDGDGVFLTARHCSADPETNKVDEHMQVSFSDNEGGPFYDAVPIAISLTDDVSLLLVRNGGNVPEVPIRDERKLRTGDPIFNVSFPMGSGKLVFHGEYMTSRFPFVPGVIAGYHWEQAMPMNLTIAHGSSGSGVYSNRERALIGVAVGTFEEGSYNIAVPADRVLDFLNDLQDNTVDKFKQAFPLQDAPSDFF
jgi:S1-C subfamily serine protease